MKRRLLALLVTVIALCCLAPGVAQAAQRTTVSDASTIWNWKELISKDTSNVGRIWTDKSVSTGDMSQSDVTVQKQEGADFLTALTALSSTSNLSSMSNTPLDIVLVLDMSSSMNESISGSDSKLAALKSAASAFVDEIAKENEGVSDTNKLHNVAVVSFNSTAAIPKGMTACTGEEVTNLKTAINNLTTSQGTRSDYGLQSAKTVLDSSKRSGSRQVVVFFTDGTPTESRTFDSKIASTAVTSAKSMKDEGAFVYTIGVLDGADPSIYPTGEGVSNENKFLHAVSSNYPSATYDGSTWSFGDRAKGSDGNDATYYKSATNAEDLKKIFEDISREIVKTSGYPTQTTDGAESTTGYITFEDQLGDYMEVSDLSTLVYNGTTYTCGRKTTKGNVDTYSFSGTVTSGAKDANLSDLIVKVTRSDNLATGDKVEVKVPATLIPLRHFNIDLSKDTMSVDETKPISVFYSSKLKSGVTVLMANPDATMKTYMAANTDENGNVKFYANKWSGDEALGDVTAEFNPAAANSYYYFTQDTPIYSDEGCTVRATSIDAGKTYYYKHEYYKNADGKPELTSDTHPFPGDKASAFAGAIDNDDNGCYFKAGTARLVYINELHSEKKENTTGTASDVLNPKWNSETSVSEATKVTSYLGNNGLLAIGNVTYSMANAGLSKVLEGRGWLDSDSFTFKLTANTEGAPLPKDANGNTVTSVELTKASVGADGKAAINFGTMTYTWDMVAGEPNKTKTYEYEVSEAVGSIAGVTYDTHKATIEVTVKDDGSGNLTATATVSGATFANSYRSSLDYTAKGGLKVAKTLTGRDMTNGQFSICVKPKDAASAKALGISEDGQTLSVPAATDGTQAVVDVLSGSTVTFTQDDAGKTYTYEVYEVGEAPAGYTYDTAKRTVTISVGDDPAKAALTVTTTVSGGPEGEKTYTYTAGGTSDAAVVPFSNSYSASTDVEGGTAVQLSGSKTLTGRSMVAGEFSFGVRLKNTEVDVLQATNKADGSISFGKLSYTTNSLADLVSRGAATKGTTDEGKPKWTISYVAYEKTDGLAEKGITAQTSPISFTVTVVDNGNGTLTATASLPTGGLAFANQYATGDPVSVGVSGVKVLNHAADLTPADITGKFNFTISSNDSAAPLPTTKTVTNDASGNVSFGNITFTLDDLNRALNPTTDDASGAGDEQANPTSENGSGEAGEANGSGKADESGEASDSGENGEASGSGVDGVAGGEAGQGANLLSDGSAQGGGEDSGQVAGLASNGAASNSGATSNSGAQISTASFKVAKASASSRSYIFVYTVTESGSVPGVTNDTSAKTVRIKLTDNGEGKLTAELLGKAGEPTFTFTNTYSVTPAESSVTDQIDVTKTLTGRSMDEGEFSFELLEGKNVVATGTNDANGKVTFGSVSYSEPGVHHYTVREVNGGTTQAGVTYDGATYQVVTTVSDNGQGGLSVKHEVVGDKPVAFANTYVAKPTSLVIGVSKTLTGATLKEGQFSFKLVGGGIELTAKNKADGTVSFPTIPFEQAGTYTFELSEVNDGQANVTYDTSSYTVKVVVTDDGQGNLVAKLSDETSGALTFVNAYTEPAPEPEPKPDADNTPGDDGSKKSKKAVPQTGDTTAPMAGILAATAGLLFVAAKLRAARK